MTVLSRMCKAQLRHLLACFLTGLVCWVSLVGNPLRSS